MDFQKEWYARFKVGGQVDDCDSIKLCHYVSNASDWFEILWR